MNTEQQIEKEAEMYYEGLPIILSTQKAIRAAYIAGRTKTIEEKDQRIKELEDACLELLNAPHYEHFAVRLNNEEMAALNKIKILLNNKH